MRSIGTWAALAAIVFFAGCSGGGKKGGFASIASTSTAAITSTGPASVTSGVTTVTSGTAAVVTATPTYPPGVSVAASMAIPRGLHTATLLGDGRVLIAGGIANGNFVLEPEVYDPLTNTFTKTIDPSLGGPVNGYMTAGPATAPVAVARILHAAVTLADGRVLICGGLGVEALGQGGAGIVSELASAHVFDPKTNAFHAVGSLNVPRRGLRAVLLPGGKVLVEGGFQQAKNGGQGASLAVAELFDPATGTFTVVGPMRLRRSDSPVAVVSDRAVLVGGDSVVPTPRSQFLFAGGSEVFDLATGAFADGPQPRYDRAGASFDAVGASSAILAGGDGPQGQVLPVEKLSNGVFVTIGTLATPRVRHASAASGTDVALVGGVKITSRSPLRFETLATIELIDAATNTIAPFTMARGRMNAAATALGPGRFLITGGFEGSTADSLGRDGVVVAAAEVLQKP